MSYHCDNCGKVLGKDAITCRGYSFITCSPGCLANLMLDIRQMNTAKFMTEEVMGE